MDKEAILYNPNESDCEKASNGYLMSVVAVMAGLPLPVINLLATLIFYLNNRRSSYFVRWHCTQTLLSQFTVLIMNSVGFSWTLSIIFGDSNISNSYVAYVITIALFNLVEIIVTIAAAVRVRKGIHVKWWFWGDIADIICKPKTTRQAWEGY